MRDHIAAVAAALACCFYSCEVHSEQPRWVLVSKGAGASFEEAKAAALKYAAQQTVGTFIASETIVSNDHLIQDKQVEYTPAIVRDFSILSEERLPDGRVSVEIKAFIEESPLLPIYTSLQRNQQSASLNGENLSDRLRLSLDSLNRKLKIYDVIFSDYYKKLLVISIDQIDVKAEDSTNAIFSLHTKVTADPEVSDAIFKAIHPLLVERAAGDKRSSPGAYMLSVKARNRDFSASIERAEYLQIGKNLFAGPDNTCNADRFLIEYKFFDDSKNVIFSKKQRVCGVDMLTREAASKLYYGIALGLDSAYDFRATFWVPVDLVSNVKEIRGEIIIAN